MQVIKYVPIESLYAKVIRDFGDVEIDFGHVVEWVGEALEDMAIAPALEYGLSIQEVKNYSTPIPDCAIQINSIMKLKIGSVEDAYTKLCESACKNEETQDVKIEEPEVLNGCCCCRCYIHLGIGDPYKTLDLMKDQFVKLYFPLEGMPGFDEKVQPVYESTYHFFKTDQVREHMLDKKGRHEFRVVEGDKILFSFKDGFVMISYLRMMTDDRGYPMIPSDYNYKEAVYRYIVYKLVEYLYWRGVDGYDRRRFIARDEWMQARRKAINSRLFTYSDAEMSNILNYMNRLIKPNNEYETGYKYHGFKTRSPRIDNTTI